MPTTIRHLATAIGLSGLSLITLIHGASQVTGAPPDEPQVVTQDPKAIPPAPALLSLIDAPDDAAPLPQARSFVAARVDINLLTAVDTGARLALDVAPGRTLTMLIDRVECRRSDSFSIFGSLEGLGASTVVMAVESDVVAADIACPPAGIHYHFKYFGDGVHLVCDLDDNAFPPCGGARPAPKRPREDFFPEAFDGADVPEGPPEGGPEGSCLCVQPTTAVFDAMVVYSDVARASAGGTNAIHAEIRLAADLTNLVYANSPVHARYRLVAMYEIMYSEQGSYEDHLDLLTYSSATGWWSIRLYRDAINADFCSLWVDDGEFCGLAWCTADANAAYSVVTLSCAAAMMSHAHEIGHNQGCAHDPDNDGGGCAAYSSSYGHQFLGQDGIAYRTAMAYPPGIRIPYFSNPNVSYQGTPTGAPSRNNTLTVNARRATCEAFEATRYDIWLDFAFSGPEYGTYANPFNTIPEGVASIDPPGLNAWELPQLLIKCNADTNWTGVLSNPMRLVSGCGGTVRIGG